MPTVHEIEEFLYELAPRDLAMEWDNVGLLVGDPDLPIRRALVALDVTEETAREAARSGFDLIVAHHPVMNLHWHQRELNTLRPDTRLGKLLIFLVKSGVAAICMHTNLDAAPGGVNDALAQVLGLTAADRYAVCAAPEEAAAAIRHFEDLAGEPPVVQAYLSGGALGCSVLAEEGRVIASICHRRVREYPVSGGPSACCDCVERPDLTAWAARMVERVGYTGLAMFEFKEDAAGEARLLEVNPRIWGTFPLTRASGSGMSLLWCLLAWNRGNPDRAAAVPPPAKPRPCRMRFVPSDLMSGLGYLRRGELRRGLAAAGDLFRPTVRDGLWEWSDPGPGLMYYKSLFRKDKP